MRRHMHTAGKAACQSRQAWACRGRLSIRSVCGVGQQELPAHSVRSAHLQHNSKGSPVDSSASMPFPLHNSTARYYKPETRGLDYEVGERLFGCLIHRQACLLPGTGPVLFYLFVYLLLSPCVRACGG